MKYLSMQAMLQADHHKLTRTEKLVEAGLGQPSGVEEVTAVHAAHTTEIAAARERLQDPRTLARSRSGDSLMPPRLFRTSW